MGEDKNKCLKNNNNKGEFYSMVLTGIVKLNILINLTKNNRFKKLSFLYIIIVIISYSNMQKLCSPFLLFLQTLSFYELIKGWQAICLLNFYFYIVFHVELLASNYVINWISTLINYISVLVFKYDDNRERRICPRDFSLSALYWLLLTVF